MKFELLTLGSNSAIPAFGRHPSAHILNHNEVLFLIDCGEGTQMRFAEHHVKPSKIKHILISHLHGDHYFGLIGFLTTQSLLRRHYPLHLYAHPGLWDILQLQFKISGVELRYDLHFHPLGEGAEQVFISDRLSVRSIPLSHRIPCHGFVFEERPKPRHLLPGVMDTYNIPPTAVPEIRAGGSFTLTTGEVVPNSQLTRAASPPKSFAYITDTCYLPEIASQFRDVDLLYHEATFDKASARRAEETYHCTTTQAAQMAKLSHAGKLLLGHFSAKFDDLRPLQAEAKEIFSNTELAIEGRTVQIGG